MLKELLKKKEIILASGSPRRYQFFKDLNIPFKIDVRPVKEVCPDYLKKEEITDFLSQLKAEAFQTELKKDQILITSDPIDHYRVKPIVFLLRYVLLRTIINLP